QLPAYTYAANNPITYSDPSGEIIPEYGNPNDLQNLTPCWGAGLGGYECQNAVEGTHGQGQGEPSASSGDSGFPKKTKSQRRHENLDGCGLVLPAGAICDVANAIIYITEGNYTDAAVSAVSTVPVLDWACKIKSWCKASAGWIADKAKAALGKAPTGPAPKIDHAADAREMAAIKADARSAASQAPAPKPPKPPTKEPGPTTKGKPSNNGGGGAPAAKSGCAKHSFDPATSVLMADGTTRPIAEVAVGDEVLAHDPMTGVTSSQTVEALHINQDESLTDLSIQTDDGSIAPLKDVS
ncbi:hypothetical protein, partial [Micromonospora sp. KC207]|uniref:hypothetical protein n=1 Tax=Micromonospora sp. KC207 TaxID=2530377 RepID=UPI001405250C